MRLLDRGYNQRKWHRKIRYGFYRHAFQRRFLSDLFSSGLQRNWRRFGHANLFEWDTRDNAVIQSLTSGGKAKDRDFSFVAAGDGSVTAK